MKRIALNEAQVKAFLGGATTLRIPVRPQPSSVYVQDGWLWKVRTKRDTTVVCRTDLAVMGLLEHNCPYPVGSELVLTETWRAWFATHADGQPIDEDWRVRYRADMAARLTGVGYDEGPLQVSPEECGLNVEPRYWRSPATMPAEFSRFKRRVVAVIVEYGELWVWVLELEVK